MVRHLLVVHIVRRPIHDAMPLVVWMLRCKLSMARIATRLEQLCTLLMLSAADHGTLVVFIRYGQEIVRGYVTTLVGFGRGIAATQVKCFPCASQRS